MGMSASQVRYCMLQARKTDIEFQGQQINQQRTTLATQSAAYNTELLTISVPTPPSTEEFTNTTYEFSYNGSDYTIKAINYMKEDYTVVDKDGNTNKYDAGTYVINYTSKQTQDTGSRGAKYGVVQRTEKDANGNSKQELYVALNGESFKLSKVDETKTENLTVEEIIHQHNVTDVLRDEIYEFMPEEKRTQQTYTTTETSDKANDVVWVAEISDGKYAYFLDSDIQSYLDTNTLDGNAYQTKTGVPSYIVSAQSRDVDDKMYGMQITWTESGRMSAVADSKGRICGLNIKTEADNDAYEDAYNEYLYQKDQYNKKMDDINAKLSTIQAQDKQLELQLRNLDTQQNAIKNEMEAVKSVCQNNIENSFKTFA